MLCFKLRLQPTVVFFYWPCCWWAINSIIAWLQIKCRIQNWTVSHSKVLPLNCFILSLKQYLVLNMSDIEIIFFCVNWQICDGSGYFVSGAKTYQTNGNYVGLWQKYILFVDILLQIILQQRTLSVMLFHGFVPQI